MENDGHGHQVPREDEEEKEEKEEEEEKEGVGDKQEIWDMRRGGAGVENPIKAITGQKLFKIFLFKS